LLAGKFIWNKQLRRPSAFSFSTEPMNAFATLKHEFSRRCGDVRVEPAAATSDEDFWARH